jgi:NADH dehydrogenase
VAKRLNKLGVKVLTDIKVETVDEQGVIAGETRIPSATVPWTAGAAASPIPKMLGTKTDRTGRTLVDPFLKVADAPGVFVVGDAASAMQNEHPVPGDEKGETVDGEPQCGGARTPSPTLRFRSCSRPRCRCSR